MSDAIKHIHSAGRVIGQPMIRLPSRYSDSFCSMIGRAGMAAGRRRVVLFQTLVVSRRNAAACFAQRKPPNMKIFAMKKSMGNLIMASLRRRYH